MGEFMVTVATAPHSSEGYAGTRDYIKYVAMVRLDLWAFTDEQRTALDPYRQERLEHPENTYPEVDEAIRTRVSNEIRWMLNGSRDEFAVQLSEPVSRPTYITGGISRDGEYPTDAFEAINALEILGFWDEPVSSAEIEAALNMRDLLLRGADRG